MKKITLLTICIIILVPFVAAGVTAPLPREINLSPGESGRFKFQIQAIKSTFPQKCTYELKGDSPLIVKFDTEEALVYAGGRTDVYGNVEVPDNLDCNIYEQEMCVSCQSTIAVGGASVKVTTCGLMIKVNVGIGNKFESEAGTESVNSFFGLPMILVFALSGILISTFTFFLFTNKKN